MLPGQHCPHKLPTFIVDPPHGDLGGRTSSMVESGAKDLQMDAGSRPKQAEAQRDPQDENSVTDASGRVDESSKTSSVPIALERLTATL